MRSHLSLLVIRSQLARRDKNHPGQRRGVGDERSVSCEDLARRTQALRLLLTMQLERYPVPGGKIDILVKD